MGSCEQYFNKRRYEAGVSADRAAIIYMCRSNIVGSHKSSSLRIVCLPTIF